MFQVYRQLYAPNPFTAETDEEIQKYVKEVEMKSPKSRTPTSHLVDTRAETASPVDDYPNAGKFSNLILRFALNCSFHTHRCCFTDARHSFASKCRTRVSNVGLNGRYGRHVLFHSHQWWAIVGTRNAKSVVFLCVKRMWGPLLFYQYSFLSCSFSVDSGRDSTFNSSRMDLEVERKRPLSYLAKLLSHADFQPRATSTPKGDVPDDIKKSRSDKKKKKMDISELFFLMFCLEMLVCVG